MLENFLINLLSFVTHTACIEWVDVEMGYKILNISFDKLFYNTKKNEDMLNIVHEYQFKMWYSVTDEYINQVGESV